MTTRPAAELPVFVLPVVDELPALEESLDPVPVVLDEPSTPPADVEPIALPESLLPVPDNPALEPFAVISPDELELEPELDDDDEPWDPEDSELEPESPDPLELLEPLVPPPSDPVLPALSPEPLELPPLEPLPAPELELPEFPSPPPPPPAVGFCALPPLLLPLAS